MNDINARITRIEWARLEGRRPRLAASNARLGPHGQTVGLPLARVSTEDGGSGFSLAHLSADRAATFLGEPLASALATEGGGVADDFRPIEYPILDLLGQRAGKPVYALFGGAPPAGAPLRIPCYDTSLYFDDLHLQDDSEAADLIAGEARDGWERGHRAFKMKVGRGAMHLPLEAGTRRDIAVIQAVRTAIGPDAPLLLDANNGYNLNLTKRVLDETADCGIYWIEEAFHEDATLYRRLKEWLRERGLPVRIADGEGDASPHLLAWAREGIVDVVQYDFLYPGFTHWLALGRRLVDWPTLTAPHHYGAHLGNYATCHLGSVLPRFQFVEWDEVDTPGIDASGYTLSDGYVTVPETPGFGLTLDEAVFQNAIQENGFALQI